jgi:DUF1680 family protein
MNTDYPDTGTVRVRVTETDGGPWSLALRVPAWASGATLDGRAVGPGTAVVRRDFAVGDEVLLVLPVRPRWTFPDPRIDAVRGCVAVERGPVVLCAESTGQDPDNLDDVLVDVTEPPADTSTGVTVAGRRRPVTDGWPYTPAAPEKPSTDSEPVTLVPYHRWARHGPSTMRVWLPKA